MQAPFSLHDRIVIAECGIVAPTSTVAGPRKGPAHSRQASIVLAHPLGHAGVGAVAGHAREDAHLDGRIVGAGKFALGSHLLGRGRFEVPHASPNGTRAASQPIFFMRSMVASPAQSTSATFSGRSRAPVEVARERLAGQAALAQGEARGATEALLRAFGPSPARYVCFEIRAANGSRRDRDRNRRSALASRATEEIPWVVDRRHTRCRCEANPANRGPQAPRRSRNP